VDYLSVSKVLVTGGTGFIGSKVVTALEAMNIEVFSPKSSNYDLRRPESWREFPACDFVIHTAVLLGDREIVSPHLPGSDNDQMLELALQFAKKNESPFLFISSYLYGESPVIPTPETSPLFPLNAYADMKLRGGTLVMNFSNVSAVPSTVLRLFNVYGPGQSDQFVIGKIIKQIKAKTPVTLRTFEVSRDFVYIDDVVSAITLSAMNQKSFSVFNVGSGTSTSLKSVIESIESILQTKIDVEVLDTSLTDKPLTTCADIKKIRQAFDWAPKIDMFTGLSNCFKN
jgi:nucleoside-diphosphate-sugar epimerase